MDWERVWVFAEVLANSENDFAISLRKLALDWFNNEVFEHIKSTFEMDMDNETFKQNNVHQIIVNATKLKYTNCGKDINGPPT